MSNLDAQIKTFLGVARLGSFRRAADELCVTQAAVTSRIKGLEEYLGFTVFHRHRRGAELTEQGERFIEYARNAIDVIEHGRAVARRAGARAAWQRHRPHRGRRPGRRRKPRPGGGAAAACGTGGGRERPRRPETALTAGARRLAGTRLRP